MNNRHRLETEFLECRNIPEHEHRWEVFYDETKADGFRLRAEICACGAMRGSAENVRIVSNGSWVADETA